MGFLLGDDEWVRLLWLSRRGGQRRYPTGAVTKRYMEKFGKSYHTILVY